MEGHTGYYNTTRTNVSQHSSKAWKVHSESVGLYLSNNATTLVSRTA